MVVSKASWTRRFDGRVFTRLGGGFYSSKSAARLEKRRLKDMWPQIRVRIVNIGSHWRGRWVLYVNRDSITYMRV